MNSSTADASGPCNITGCHIGGHDNKLLFFSTGDVSTHGPCGMVGKNKAADHCYVWTSFICTLNKVGKLHMRKVSLL